MFFFFNDTATTEIYTLSLHDALPISCVRLSRRSAVQGRSPGGQRRLLLLRERFRQSSTSAVQTHHRAWSSGTRSEEHTSELQSRQYLVCRLLLEKKKKKTYKT